LSDVGHVAVKDFFKKTVTFFTFIFAVLLQILDCMNYDSKHA